MIGVDTGPTLWDTVVVNMAPIIIALTGFGAMIGGFYMQKRMMDRQNEKIDRNFREAGEARSTLATKMDKVAESTNGIVKRNETLARSLGVSEGTAAGLQQGRDEHPAP